MGEIVIGKCSCGYESELISIGSGMFCASLDPVICEQCGTLSTQDTDLLPDAPCEKCGGPVRSLEELDLHRPSGIAEQYNSATSWTVSYKLIGNAPNEKIPEIFYFCPKCKKLNMQLIEYGLWD